MACHLHEEIQLLAKYDAEHRQKLRPKKTQNIATK
jgi:hypothetical protein